MNQDIRIQYATDKRCFVHIIIENASLINYVCGTVGNRLQKSIQTASLRDSQKAIVPTPQVVNLFYAGR